MEKVEKLTDNVPNVTWEPLGTIGEIRPSQCENRLTAEIFDSIRHYGTRKAEDKEGRRFFQALVWQFVDYGWINIYAL